MGSCAAKFEQTICVEDSQNHSDEGRRQAPTARRRSGIPWRVVAIQMHN